QKAQLTRCTRHVSVGGTVVPSLVMSGARDVISCYGFAGAGWRRHPLQT
ncbi:unnamed protein product, partial [Laminaria digitata]